MIYLKKYETVNNQGYIVDEPIFKNDLIKIDRNFKNKLWLEIRYEKYYDIAIIVAELISFSVLRTVGNVPYIDLNDKKLREIPIIDNDKDQIKRDIYLDLFMFSDRPQRLMVMDQIFVDYLESIFAKEIRMMVLDSMTLGELIDKMVIFKEELISKLPALHNQMEAEKQGKKFGI